MKGRKPDYRLMTSRDKRNGDGKIYTTIGAAWIVGNNAISLRFEALPMSENAVLIPATENETDTQHPQEFAVTDDEWGSDIPF